MIKDIDGNKYNTIKIGKQVWTVQNLNVERYRNGDLIPQIKDENKLQNTTTGAWCYFWNNKEKDKLFGKLYNWYAVTDPRGLTPKGWHIPNDNEWLELKHSFEYKLAIKLFGEIISPRDFRDKMDYVIKNDSVYLNRSDELLIGFFELFSKIGKFWSSSYDKYAHVIHYNHSSINLNIINNIFKKEDFFYVRCVKD